MDKEDAKMSRRSMVTGAISAAAALSTGSAAGSGSERVVKKGRLKQSVCKWCYEDMTVADLAENASRIGLGAVDLLEADDWPLMKKYGIVCAVGTGVNPIEDGINDLANHSTIEANFRRLLPLAKQHGVPNVIAFSGNRRGMEDERAWDNSTLLLNKLKAQAEDLGVTIIMELLNSKVDHPDYQCDNTPWGVEVMRRVDSRRVKLLYDIYHMQIMEGDVIRTIRDNIQYIAHFHTGGNPGRAEIDETQELNYRAIAEAILALGFDGYFAHEFIPERDPMTSLREAAKLCDV